MRYLGLDLGTRTLGISISDETKTIASGLTTLRFEEGDYDAILDDLRKILEENKIEKIVLGLPKNMNNTLGDRAETTIMFQKKIEELFNIEVILQDERLSTVAAHNYLLEADKMEEKMTFKALNKDGVEVECEVLFTFESDETKKNYMVYTDNTTDENGNVRVYASIYNPDQPESDLIPIESEAEWKIIETILEEIQAEVRESASEE